MPREFAKNLNADRGYACQSQERWTKLTPDPVSFLLLILPAAFFPVTLHWTGFLSFTALAVASATWMDMLSPSQAAPLQDLSFLIVQLTLSWNKALLTKCSSFHGNTVHDVWIGKQLLPSRLAESTSTVVWSILSWAFCSSARQGAAKELPESAG